MSAPTDVRTASAPPLNAADWEARARARMEPSAFDYFAGGAGDEGTLADNARSWSQWLLRPRALVDVGTIDTSVELLGARLAMPVLIAPMAFQRLAHPDGELATARAAAALGTAMIVSTVASVSLEHIAASADAPRWFQLYIYKDRGLARGLVERAERAGYRAIVLTVDTPVLGRRERDLRNRFELPAGIVQANFETDHPLLLGRRGDDNPVDFAAYANTSLDPTLTWEALATLRSWTKLPVLVKGVVTAEDARFALAHGVAGIVVSNHGGRQLDGAIPTARALPEVVEAVAGAVPVLVDGGIRRGADVLRALALGARAVLVGRPCLWGLAVDGEAGVHAVLDMLRQELESAMALAGRPSLASVDRTLVVAR
jgi:4-hydroxymandelate oxidase